MSAEFLSNTYNAAFFWTWFLLWTRLLGVFTSLVGIGTESVPASVRLVVASVISFAVALATKEHVALPQQLLTGGILVTMEFMLGYLLGAVPSLIFAGVSVAGHVTTGVMGLSQAFMIDQSLGEHITVFAKLQMLIAITVFLFLDGHHAVIRAAAGMLGDLPIGAFRPNGDIAMFFVDRLRDSFELALNITAPVLVTILVTQFVLGLITRAVPQMNIFIMSMPLTILLGFFVVAYCFSGFSDHMTAALTPLEEYLGAILSK